MNKLSDFAENCIIAGLSVIPTKADKSPALAKWDMYQNEAIDLDDVADIFKSAKGIGVIGGMVSGNLEMIDFDKHDQDIDSIWLKFRRDNKEILNRYDFYVERTLRGGYHLFYRVDYHKQFASQKLAYWSDREAMIETKASGGYCVVAPSAGYEVVHGDITLIPIITIDEREQLIASCRSFSIVKEDEKADERKPGEHHFTDPVSWYNWTKQSHAKYLLEKAGWKRYKDSNNIEQWTRPDKSEGVSATWGHKDNHFYVFTSGGTPFKQFIYYTPFQILTLLKFEGSYSSAINYVIMKWHDDKNPYLRVGTDYYKKIIKKDRYGIEGIELKVWSKDEIKQDMGKEFMNKVPKFDDFCIRPDNFDYKQIHNNEYNLYNKFRHIPKAGSIQWTNILMNHVFGDQIELGYRYLQVLYLHPDRMLPILVLVSKERQTGKTTFLNWMNMIFGNNMVVISPEDLVNGFNSVYARANIIAVEETLIEKSITVEKLKALSTGKLITINMKYVNQFSLPFYGKIIMTSNNEDKFAKIDDEEIRFFIRKLSYPKFKNHNIEQDLINEIPALLDYLLKRPAVDFSVGRVPFTTDELYNENLSAVVKESKTGLYKDLYELFIDLFENSTTGQTEIMATPIDIKRRWFLSNSQIQTHYIRSVMKNEFKFPLSVNTRYSPFGENGETKTGTPYIISAEYFDISVDLSKSEFPF